MTKAIEIQIIIYMVILAFIAFAWGYTKGHRDGKVIGAIQTRRNLRMIEKAGK